MDNIDQILTQIRSEEERNLNFLHLTANENQMSNTANYFLGSKISERYFMGAGKDDVVDFGHFTALGFKGVDKLIVSAENAAKEMLSASSVNLNVLSGVHAMMSAILSTTNPGDIVMTVPLESGGHFATKKIIDVIGRKHVYADYDYANLKFDTEKIAKKFKEENVKALYLDVSYYLNPHNLKEIRKSIGDKAIIIYDASHTMGLIMGQQFQSPLKEGANVICANTHKTLPGPHKGMIAFRDNDLAEKANTIINSCLYSTPHMTHLIALSITILELKEFGVDYAKQIISNSNSIAEAFVKLGYEVRKANTGRYSENHQVHIFIDDKGEKLSLYKNLLNNNISTNFENSELTLNNRMYIRLGTAEITRRGMKTEEMSVIADLVDRALKGEDVINKVINLNSKHPKILYSFDNN
ncbi:DegT/DnrJ/EryC1/StrS family aminotransferase [Patescibacteria group bacterium]|nr:DegT/DnrJ/EryC1/StrS family aminotransferase [Patescibacteria group bacterium]